MKQIAIAARARIENPAHWTKGACARDHISRVVFASDPAACRWCYFGAILLEIGQGHKDTVTNWPPTNDTIADRFQTVIGRPIGTVNDNSTHAEMLAHIDRFIAAL